MKSYRNSVGSSAFTLLETVIAIGVLAVLLTGFMVVFAPAAAGIRKSINVQEADRLTSALEQELVNARPNEPGTFKIGFDKAYSWIENSKTSTNAILVYQYRAEIGSIRPDNTPKPLATVTNKQPGKDYVVVPMARRLSDPVFKDDLPAIEGGVYLVKCTQLVFDKTTGGTGGLILSTSAKIIDPKASGAAVTGSTDYPEAVIAFSADFYSLPAKSSSFFTGSAFTTAFTKAKTPVFTRNLAVRR